MISYHSPTPIRVLALMPMLVGYEAIRATVATTVKNVGFELVWLQDLLEDWEWLNWLYASISQCHLVLANPTKHNAFVMYELGVLRAHVRPTLVMLDREDSH